MSPRRRPDPELKLSVVDVDPDVAANWMEYNTHNRKISPRLVNVYAETMLEGDWRLNGEPIIFDKNGRLQSGQHRLLAVIESGVTIRTVLVEGAEPENIYSLESGRRRRLTDVLVLNGEKNVMALSAALSWTWRWEHHLMDRGGETPTHTHLLRVLEKHPDLRDDLSEGMRPKTAGFSTSVGVMSALYHQFKRLDEEDCKNFWEHIVSGADLSADHPAFVWRRWASKIDLAQSRPSQAKIAAMTVKAWSAYREHRVIKNLSWRPEESFPEAV